MASPRRHSCQCNPAHPERQPQNSQTSARQAQNCPRRPVAEAAPALPLSPRKTLPSSSPRAARTARGSQAHSISPPTAQPNRGPTGRGHQGPRPACASRGDCVLGCMPQQLPQAAPIARCPGTPNSIPLCGRNWECWGLKSRRRAASPGPIPAILQGGTPMPRPKVTGLPSQRGLQPPCRARDAPALSWASPLHRQGAWATCCTRHCGLDALTASCCSSGDCALSASQGSLEEPLGLGGMGQGQQSSDWPTSLRMGRLPLSPGSLSRPGWAAGHPSLGRQLGAGPCSLPPSFGDLPAPVWESIHSQS